MTRDKQLVGSANAGAHTGNIPRWTMETGSLAHSLVSLRDGAAIAPLYPQVPPFADPRIVGSPDTGIQYPLEVGYNYSELSHSFFHQGIGVGLYRWQALLPPLRPGLSLGEGGTPLLSCPNAEAWVGLTGLLVKDESRNPTWSHKDRLSLCTVSAAAAAGAVGTVISSSGNHGASAAAYSARAGMKCIVLCDDGVSRSHAELMCSYSAAVVAAPRNMRWPLLERLAQEEGWYLVGNTAPMHTGHPFGPEGYKTIAYELFVQLGGVLPAVVCVPTSYGELLFGLAKGFGEIIDSGLAPRMPLLVSAEPKGSDTLARAWKSNELTVRLTPAWTVARGIGSAQNGYRGLAALRRSSGIAISVCDADILAAQRALALDGIWAELASCAGLAACRELTRQGDIPDGPVVHISTSSGLKNVDQSSPSLPFVTSAKWDELKSTLKKNYGLVFP